MLDLDAISKMTLKEFTQYLNSLDQDSLSVLELRLLDFTNGFLLGSTIVKENAAIDLQPVLYQALTQSMEDQ